MLQNNSLSEDNLDLSLMNLNENNLKRNPYLVQCSGTRGTGRKHAAAQRSIAQRQTLQHPASQRPQSRVAAQRSSVQQQSSRPAMQRSSAQQQSSRPAMQRSSAQQQSSRSAAQKPSAQYLQTRPAVHRQEGKQIQAHPAAPYQVVQRPASQYSAERYGMKNPTEEYLQPQAHQQSPVRPQPQARSQSPVRSQPQVRPQSRVRPQSPARPASRPAVQSRAMEQHRLRQEEIRRKRLLMAAAELMAVVVLGLVVVLMVNKPKVQPAELPAEEIYQPAEDMVQQNVSEEKIQGISAEVYAKHPEWTEDFLTPNEYSRPGDPLTQVNNIFVHYTANPGTSAAQNRSYFEQQKDTHEASVSSHFIIGYNGEILQIVPLDEIAYAVMTRNEDSISIECCYKAENGQFTQETYDSLISLLSWLTEAYDLDSEDILRHYDCGGKKCPLYYTEHEDAWERLKKDVADYTL